MSVAKFGSNILIDGGGGVGNAVYNATVMNLLHQLSMSETGRIVLSEIARRVRAARIVRLDAEPAKVGGEVVVYYTPSAWDTDGQLLLEALARATAPAPPRTPAGHDLQVTKKVDVAHASLWR
jgi:hypothetical protein